MRYSTPELVVLGPASIFVRGGDLGHLDNGTSDSSQPMSGVALGLDD
jgi:hypothetical protein